jgi:hypothetical protein
MLTDPAAMILVLTLGPRKNSALIEGAYILVLAHRLLTLKLLTHPMLMLAALANNVLALSSSALTEVA